MTFLTFSSKRLLCHVHRRLWRAYYSHAVSNTISFSRIKAKTAQYRVQGNDVLNYLPILHNIHVSNLLVRHAHFEGAPPRDPSAFSLLSEGEYDEIADETLESLADKFDVLVEEGVTSQDYDVQFASGVLTIKLGGSLGTYVINKQTPNKQIWFSSPTSGPKRYDFVDGTWIYKHDGKPMHTRLTEEISNALNSPIDFTICSYGKRDR